VLLEGREGSGAGQWDLASAGKRSQGCGGAGHAQRWGSRSGGGRKQGRGARRKGKELTGGSRLAERERERREGAARAGKLGRQGPRGERKERQASGSAWARQKRERRGSPREREMVLGRVGLPFSLLSFSSFPTHKLFKQFYLNPNKFEFKPYKLNTRKTMLQHECTNMLTF
jgi:hypothetical protein